MEGKKPAAPSSSIVEDLFGRKDNSSDIFGFSSPSAAGRYSSHSELLGSSRKQEAEAPVIDRSNDALLETGPDVNALFDLFSSKNDGNSHGNPSKGQSVPGKIKNPEYQAETTTPCHLSSSLYYGGQDIYSSYPSNQTSGAHNINNQYKKDGEDDQNNSNLASRGNWWQGSLYY